MRLLNEAIAWLSPRLFNSSATASSSLSTGSVVAQATSSEVALSSHILLSARTGLFGKSYQKCVKNMLSEFRNTWQMSLILEKPLTPDDVPNYSEFYKRYDPTNFVSTHSDTFETVPAGNNSLKLTESLPAKTTIELETVRSLVSAATISPLGAIFDCYRNRRKVY